MKKIICAKLLTVFVINMLVVPVINGGKKKQKLMQDRGRNQRHKAQKWHHTKMDKKKRRKISKERKRLELLRIKTKERSKVLKGRASSDTYNRLVHKVKEKRRRTRNNNSDVAFHSTGMRMPKGILSLLVFIMCMTRSFSIGYVPIAEIPECIADWYPLRISNKDFESDPGTETFCYCTGDPSGVQYLECDLAILVHELECESYWYRVELDYLVPISITTYCFCSPMDGGNDLAMLNCNGEHASINIGKFCPSCCETSYHIPSQNASMVGIVCPSQEGEKIPTLDTVSRVALIVIPPALCLSGCATLPLWLYLLKKICEKRQEKIMVERDVSSGESDTSSDSMTEAEDTDEEESISGTTTERTTDTTSDDFTEENSTETEESCTSSDFEEK